MNLAELVQEVLDRGYDFEKTSRIQRFVNASHKKICARYPWPFTETDASGASPLLIADLRDVISVSDTTNGVPLSEVDRRSIVRSDPDLSTAGNPCAYYRDDKTIQPYPTTSVTLDVRYWKIPADLTGTDEPIFDDEWHELIVDDAVIRCLKDDDEYGTAAALRTSVEQDILEMARSHGMRQPSSARRTGYACDYL